MTNLERKLKGALRRKEAPNGFAERVLEQLDEFRPAKRSRVRRTTFLSRIAATLLVGVIGAGAWMQHQDRVREWKQAEEASVLVKLALHIASEKTNIARKHLTGVDTDSKRSEKKGTENEKTND